MAPTDSPSAGRADRIARRAPVALVVAAVGFYSTGPVMVASTSVTGPVFAFWRLWFGVAVVGAAAAVHRWRGGERPDGRGLRIALLAGLAFGVHQLLFMSAVKASSVVDVTLLGTLQPIVVTVVAVPLFGERPRPAFRLWSIAAIAGAGVVVVAGSTGAAGSTWGMALATANVVVFSAFFLVSKVARERVAVLPFLFVVMAVAAVVSSGFAFATGADVASASRSDLLWAVVVAIVPGTLGHAFMTWPLPHLPANVPPVIKLAIPGLSGGLAWLILGQTITGLHVLGGALTLMGVSGALLSAAGRELLIREEQPPEPAGVER